MEGLAPYPTYGVVIVTYQQPINFYRCIKCLINSSVKPELVVVVDVGAHTLARFVEESGEYTIVPGAPENGYSENANMGVRKLFELKPDIERLLFLGNDVFVLRPFPA